MTSLNGKDYTQRKPFKNPTIYKVGQIRKFDGIYYTITSILRITQGSFGIYGYPVSQTIKLDMCEEAQKRREGGQLNVMLTGRLLFVEKLS